MQRLHRTSRLTALLKLSSPSSAMHAPVRSATKKQPQQRHNSSLKQPRSAADKSSSNSSSGRDTTEAAQRAARTHRAAGEQEDALRRAEANKAYQARYKSAARRWVSSVVALPILLVTSYYLFDRLVMGHEQKELPWKRPSKKDGE